MTLILLGGYHGLVERVGGDIYRGQDVAYDCLDWPMLLETLGLTLNETTGTVNI